MHVPTSGILLIHDVLVKKDKDQHKGEEGEYDIDIRKRGRIQ